MTKAIATNKNISIPDNRPILVKNKSKVILTKKVFKDYKTDLFFDELMKKPELINELDKIIKNVQPLEESTKNTA